MEKKLSKFFPDKVLKADIRYPLLLNFSKIPSVLINFDAEHRDDVKPLTLYEEVNEEGARNVCELARAQNVNKIIFTSSVAIYGFASLGADECGSINLFNNYGRTKWELEQIYKK